jgi:hypothetical protein
MFFNDYCLCYNSDKCSHKDECLRAKHLVGIHTYSDFYKDEEECEYFLEKENINEHNF